MKQKAAGSIAVSILLAAMSLPAVAQTSPADTDKVAALLNEAPPPTTSLDGVVLSTQKGDQRLLSIPGAFSTTYAFVTVLLFMDYPDLHASTRTTDTHPTLHLKMGVNPKGRVYLVKVESNTKSNNRSVKLGHSGFGSIGGMTAPDSKWAVACTITEEAPGIWKLVPDAPLARGEYGIFTPNLAGGTQVPASGELYDFGVDG
jgi:hypothetical protein